jgi:hypothetical protein
MFTERIPKDGKTPSDTIYPLTIALLKFQEGLIGKNFYL